MNNILGIILSLSAAFFAAAGETALHLVGKQKETEHVTHQQRLTYFGMVSLVLINPVLTIISLHYAATSIVVPFSGSRVVFNFILMIATEKTVVSLVRVTLTSLTCVGLGIVAYTGINLDLVDDKEPTHINRFIIVTSGSILLMLGLATVATILEHRYRTLIYALTSGTLSGLAQTLIDVFLATPDLLIACCTLMALVGHFLYLLLALRLHNAAIVSPPMIAALIISGVFYSGGYHENLDEIVSLSFMLGIVLTTLSIAALICIVDDKNKPIY